MIETIKVWKSKHPDLYEFILFNIMSNVATITNFLVLAIATNFIFKGLSSQSFEWFIFDYTLENGGLCGFLGFLTAYVAAQIVNFIVQRKVVFGATCDILKVLPWYIATVVLAGILSIWLPPYIINYVTPYIGSTVATYVANIVNIILQVVINYPMMKFVIMKKD